ncbi:hypothetical protein [Anabaena lutea]|uniref:hypothetical protein n=1 Tax=Anabaena lutea TaxID=212350 RepID=UPI00168A2E61|nr:hypothetical protein [Anabaena lutea]
MRSACSSIVDIVPVIEKVRYEESQRTLQEQAIRTASSFFYNTHTKIPFLLQFTLISSFLFIGRFRTPIWEFFELRANFLHQNLPLTSIKLTQQTFQSS